MFDLKTQLGIKSFSFRSITDNTTVVAAVKQCGVNAIDLSACHIDYDDITAQEQAIAIYQKAGICISGIGVVNLRNDEPFNRRFFAFARMADCETISCSFPPENHESILHIAEKLADEYGMRLAIHNHGGMNWLGNSTALRYVLAKVGPRFGICLDTAWCLQAGEDPLAWMAAFADRIYAVHFKDFVFDQRGKWKDTIVGEGALDLGAFLTKFTASPFQGSAVVEFEGEDAVSQSKACIEAIRARV